MLLLMAIAAPHMLFAYTRDHGALMLIVRFSPLMFFYYYFRHAIATLFHYAMPYHIAVYIAATALPAAAMLPRCCRCCFSLLGASHAAMPLLLLMLHITPLICFSPLRCHDAAIAFSPLSMSIFDFHVISLPPLPPLRFRFHAAIFADFVDAAFRFRFFAAGCHAYFAGRFAAAVTTTVVTPYHVTALMFMPYMMLCCCAIIVYAATPYAMLLCYSACCCHDMPAFFVDAAAAFHGAAAVCC